MKLKEKLAVEHLASLESWEVLSKKEMEIYIAGFEKAREMAYSVVAYPPINKSKLTAVSELGEEEVE